MDAQLSRFNRNLLILLVFLYFLTIAAFSYANWVANPAFMQWWMTLLNALILSIPLVLLYGSIYVLVVAWREHVSRRQVSHRLAKIIHRAPRIAAILIIIFVSLFSLDVFEMRAPPLEMLVGFLVHNIPSFVMIVLLIFAWKRPGVGFAAFLIAAILSGAFFLRGLYSLPNLLLFVLPILLIALLFYADWKWVLPQPPSQAGEAQ